MSSILKVDTIQTAAGGTPTAADLGLNVSGSVLQVQHASVASNITTSSGQDLTILTVNVTPKSASSKLFVTTSGWGMAIDNRGSQYTDSGYFLIKRDGSEIGRAYMFSQGSDATRALSALSSNSLVDSGSTAQTSFVVSITGGEVYDLVTIQNDIPITLTVFEIAG